LRRRPSDRVAHPFVSCHLTKSRRRMIPLRRVIAPRLVFRVAAPFELKGVGRVAHPFVSLHLVKQRGRVIPLQRVIAARLVFRVADPFELKRGGGLTYRVPWPTD
jgi:hypothetical protein